MSNAPIPYAPIQMYWYEYLSFEGDYGDYVTGAGHDNINGLDDSGSLAAAAADSQIASRDLSVVVQFLKEVNAI